jgi:hypothetical protein
VSECTSCVNWCQVTRIKKITGHLQRGINRQVYREQRIAWWSNQHFYETD